MDNPYYFKRLKNGIKVILIPMKDINLVNINVNILNGTINESKKDIECAHLIEHLNAQFTSEKYPNAHENNRQINIYGGRTNAFVNNYITGYYIYGLTKYFDYFFDLILNSYAHFKVDEKIFQKEKNAVLQELRNYYNNTSWLKLEESIYNILYKNHPYSVTIEQRIKNTKKIDLDHILRYRKKYYGTTNTEIVISGNINVRKVFHKLNDFFEDYPRINKKVIYPKFNHKLKKLELIHTPMKNKKSSKVYIFFPFPIIQFDFDFYASKLMKLVLTDNFSSRLYKLRRQHGFIYHISSKTSVDNLNKNLSYFIIETSTKKENVREVISIILKEIKTLQNELITDNEFLLIQNKIKMYKRKFIMDKNLFTYDSRYSLPYFFNKKVLNFEDEYKRMLKIDKKYIKKLFNLIEFDKVLVGFT